MWPGAEHTKQALSSIPSTKKGRKERKRKGRERGRENVHMYREGRVPGKKQGFMITSTPPTRVRGCLDSSCAAAIDYNRLSNV